MILNVKEGLYLYIVQYDTCKFFGGRDRNASIVFMLNETENHTESSQKVVQYFFQSALSTLVSSFSRRKPRHSSEL